MTLQELIKLAHETASGCSVQSILSKELFLLSTSGPVEITKLEFSEDKTTIYVNLGEP